MNESVILALWGAASVFVLWVALASIARERWARRTAPATPTGPVAAEEFVPDPTPEEILQAQALGLIPPGGPSGPYSAS